MSTSSLSGWSLADSNTDASSDFSDVSYEEDELVEDFEDLVGDDKCPSFDQHAPHAARHAEPRIRDKLSLGLPRSSLPSPRKHVPARSEPSEARRQARKAEELEAVAEELQRREYRIRLERLKKEEHVRALTCERVRRFRQQKKATKENCRPKASMLDDLGRTQEPQLGPATAQVSRPYRHFKIDASADLSKRGRKRTRADSDARKINCTNQLLFEQICSAARDCGPWMRPAEIVKCLQRRNPRDFAALTPQVLGRYIERPLDSFPHWRPEVLRRVEARGGMRPGVQSHHCGVLSTHPEVVDEILQQLIAIREAGIMITVDNARGIILGIIQHRAPQLLEQVLSDGSRFVCSDAYVRRFLYQHLRWVPRKSTRAQKTPENADNILWELFIRLVVSLRDAGIRHGGLYVNFDQTQVVIADPSTRTFAREGNRQVSTVNKEEKRAWTAVVGVASDGSVSPTQVIMKGSSPRSLPSQNAPHRDDALAIGLRFDLNPTNYWSSAPLMEVYFEHVIVPFFEGNKAAHGLGSSGLLFAVVGLGFGYAMSQLAIRQGQQQHIISETLQHLRSGAVATAIRLDNRIGTLRDRAVSWFTDAWHSINQPSLVKNAFEKCAVRGGFNLSFESLTSPAALKAVRDLPRSDPALWAKISADYARSTGEDSDDELSGMPDLVEESELSDASVSDGENESTVVYDDQVDLGDDSGMEPADLMAHIFAPREQSDTTPAVGQGLADGLVSDSEHPVVQSDEEQMGRGKRRKVANKQYKDYGMH
ncbi:unnamed protein product [Peniophora sp. CBMAI 1063]|nr:unnamed protein product [Peniophora sp. CBMAI 1063]